MTSYQGRCLCGQVRFRISGPFKQFHLCHCSRCRHATGSAHASNLFIGNDQIEWLAGEERIQRFDLPEAQRFARAFCRHCGAPVPHQSRDGNGFIVPAGSLDQAPDRQPDDHIHFDSRAPWYNGTLQAPRFSAAPGSPPPIDPA
ncbi:hypothetical protein SAMN05877962_10160 [Alloalcanivorax xenomutans]|uniref:GFA family protein n=1 Tax=Alloalcanivorax xenomutans TaxID=1094342 RepID=UPI000BD1FFF8|nr:GFA family protein [Alloalcanivorax xenomutans]SOB89729.1 hypothetical protein SAMN05877962_10160 [Alloalcanivorax xenomutans]